MTCRVTLMGGTANQVFQYAAAMTLVGPANLDDIIANCTLLDAYANTPGITPRQFALGQIGVVPRRDVGPSGAIYHESLPQTYDPCQDYCLRGYFQRLKFFPLWVRDWFRERIPQVAKRPGTLAVHVRRGDYVSNPSATAWHGVTPLEFYVKSAKELIANNPIEHICLYSDDRGWCHDHLLPAIGPTVSVEIPTETADPWNDIAGMASCDHHIISNSTFGWVGAYLADSKQVIYPKNWLTDGKPAPPIFPENWRGI